MALNKCCILCYAMILNVQIDLEFNHHASVAQKVDKIDKSVSTGRFT